MNIYNDRGNECLEVNRPGESLWEPRSGQGVLSEEVTFEVRPEGDERRGSRQRTDGTKALRQERAWHVTFSAPAT